MIKEENPYGFIYITTNLINGKKYIGQKKYDEKGNWKSYLGSGKYLINAIKKYGRKNFVLERIVDVYSYDNMNELEIYYIEKYDAVNSADYYNIASGGKLANVFAGKSEKEMAVLKDKYYEAIGKRKLELTYDILCVNTGEVFKSAREAGKKYKIDSCCIIKCCRPLGRLKSAGKHPDTGEKMIWKFLPKEGKGLKKF